MATPEFRASRAPRQKFEILMQVRAQLGEHFDDYVILARTRNPDAFTWVISDPEWAAGACARTLRRLEETE